MKILLQILFTALFLAITSYIVYFETERYESESIVLLKDLSEQQKIDLGSMILGQSSGTAQDSRVLELYLRSNDMYDFIDSEYNLTNYYTGHRLDFYQRLYPNAYLPFYLDSKENLLKRYNEDLQVVYDEPSGTLSLSFAYDTPQTAQKILKSMIRHADNVINNFSKENAEISLHFIEKQKVKNRATYIDSIKKLLAYQNKHHTIDPNMDVERTSTILAQLEGELIKNQVEYASNLKYYNPNGKDMRILKQMGENLKRSIAKLKEKMAGTNELNRNVFDFELLKSDMDFNKEIYRQTLINQEKLKMEVSQNAKHMIVVSKPTLPDSYTYPNKPWDIFTWLIIILFLYGIIMIIVTIIKDHQD